MPAWIFVALSLWAFACGGSDASSSGGRTGGSGELDGGSLGGRSDGSTNAGDGTDAGRADSGPGSQFDAGPAPVFDAGNKELRIEPDNPTVVVDGSPSSLSLSATFDGVPLDSVNWTVDGTTLASIDADGELQLVGNIAGDVVVTAHFGSVTASTTVRVQVEWEQTGSGVSDAQATALEGDATEDAAFRFLYPYDDTVFPRGLAAPFMQLDGGDADAVRISARAGDFHYTGTFGATSPASVTLPQAVWDSLLMSSDGSAAAEIEVTKLVADAVVGPAALRFRVAPSDLKGIIYYNTYDSEQTGSGAVMRIEPGQDAEVLIDGCTVCHSVSADGSALAAGVEWGSGNPLTSALFDLFDDGTAPVRYSNDEGRDFPFAGLTPDGNMLISNGVPESGPAIRGLGGARASALYDATSGQMIDAPSFTDFVTYALTPAFSPDGKRLAFNWQEQNSSRTLAVMDVDLGATPPSFSEPEIAVTVDQGVAGWPSFLPDGEAVIYHDGDRFDTAAYGAIASYAELHMVDLTDHSVHDLKNMNGWREDGSSYLPHGADEENRRNYEPSVLPLPVGGYYWVLFTSRRAYGHTLAPGGTVADSGNEWGDFENNTEYPSPRKKLWLSAIDVDYRGKVDPSHPALYLPGQELMAGNMRGYAALSPCLELGQTCESGADCCEGFCRAAGDVGDMVCVIPPTTCSFTDEACSIDADCCGAPDGERCINNHCAAPTPILQ